MLYNIVTPIEQEYSFNKAAIDLPSICFIITFRMW
jgi:hypothetical protein